MRFGRRAGIIISGMWIVGSIIGLRSADLRVTRFLRYSAFEVCDWLNHRLGDFGDCWHSLMKAAATLDGSWADIAIVVLAPVLLGWLVAAIVLKLRR